MTYPLAIRSGPLAVKLLLLLVAVTGLAPAQVRFRFQSSQQAWILRNNNAQFEFRFSKDRVRFVRAFEFRDRYAWTPPSGTVSIPFSIEAGGVTFDNTVAYRLVSHNVEAAGRGGTRQNIVLEDTRSLAEITLQMEMYPAQPVLRYRAILRNLRPETVSVANVGLLPWQFAADAEEYRAFSVHQWANGGATANFEPVETTLPQGGKVELLSGADSLFCTWLAWRDSANHGLFAGWEFNGHTEASLSREDSRLILNGRIAGIEHPVPSQDSFTSPWAFLGLFQGNWDDAGHRTQRFAESALALPAPDPFPYVMWDSWKYQTDIDEDTLRRNADIAASLGVEVFVIDLGWAAEIGDWRADLKKFPSGLRSLSDYVHSLGMKFGLHFPLAEANVTSPVLRQNPDWTSSRIYGYFGAASLCLSHQPVRDWIIGQAVRMIDEYNVDWIVQDGESMVKHCEKTTHTHQQWDSNYSNAVEGIDAVVAAVRQARPAVMWENCEDGGNMMTFNMVNNYVTSISSDDAGPLTTRQAVYGATFPFPTRYTDRYMPDEALSKYTVRSYMFGGPWIFMNRLPLMTAEDLALASSEVNLFKQLRSHIRAGRVYHLTAPPDGQQIDAMESYDSGSDTAVVFVYRPAADATTFLLRPLGLRADNCYRVRFQDDSAILYRTGEELMKAGVSVSLPEPYSAEIAFIEPVAVE